MSSGVVGVGLGPAHLPVPEEPFHAKTWIDKVAGKLAGSAGALRSELALLGQESDPELFFQGLLNLALRGKELGQLEWAMSVYSEIIAAAKAEPVVAQAQQELNAILGKGAFGARAEFLFKQIAKDSTDPKIILPMMGASIIGSLSKNIILGRLVTRPTALFTRGLGAKALAGAGGFGLEGAAFAGFGRLMTPSTGESFVADLARSYVGLGALKLSGSAARRATPSWAGAYFKIAAPQLSMFTGLLLAHKLETRWGLRPESSSDHLFADTLAAMVSLQIGTKLGHSALGKKFQSLQQEIELRSQGPGLGTALKAASAQFSQAGFNQWATPEGFRFPGISLSENRDVPKRAEAAGIKAKQGSKAPREAMELKGEFRFADPKRWTEVEIEAVVKAIGAQDQELYPGGDVGLMSTGPRFFSRWYRVNGEDLMLSTLASRVSRDRGLGVGDAKFLLNSQIVREWKEKLFGRKVERIQGSLEISDEFQFADPKLWTEAEINKLVKAIVAQDRELYPDGNAGLMSTGAKFFKRWYRVNGEDVALSTLAGRVRRARGLPAGDTKTLSSSQLVCEWKEKIFGIEVEKAAEKSLEIFGEIHFADQKLWTEAEIAEVIKAIVAQDQELYPGGDVGSMTTGRQFFKRWYRVNGEDLQISTLVCRFRRARGLRPLDGKTLPDAQIIREWKEKIFGIKVEEVIRESLEISGTFPVADPQLWTEAEVRDVVKAIVAQDKELYPNGDAGWMSTGSQFFYRWYRVNGEDLMLSTLGGRVRQARELPAGDTKTLPYSQIIREWKERIFGIKVEGVIRESLVISGAFPVADQQLWTEAEVREVVKAIVVQDKELYPDGDARAMSTGDQAFKRWYRLNGEDLALSTLASRIRRARGLRADDVKTLSGFQIVREWKEQIFGIKVEEIIRESLEISGEFPILDPRLWTEVEVRKVVKAIVTQDKELYPDGDARRMSTGSQYFHRRYRVNGKDLELSTLVGRARRARGLRTGDTKALSDFQILSEWKERIFGVKVEPLVWEGLEILGEFPVANPLRWTEAEIIELIKAIVAQDKDLYPDGDARALSAGDWFFNGRRYRVNEEDLTLGTLAGRVRQARGLRAGDSKILPRSQIIREWKQSLGVFEFNNFDKAALDKFIAEANLRPLLDLFSEGPGQLVEALSFLKKAEFINNDIADFVKAYVGLQVEGGGKSGTGLSWDPGERRNKYLQAIFEALERGDPLDLSEANFASQLQLLIRLSRKSFEAAPEQLIRELEGLASQASHPFLQRLQSETANYFRSARQFRITGMRNPPYGYQREGAHFLATHDQAILADEAGMGKSYQVIAATERLGLKRVLWVTTAANKETLREELFQHSSVKNEDVKVVISGDPKERKDQIERLNGERYIITNYETLVAMQKYDPAGYAKLTKDLDLIVVDEAQLTDNPEALRTKAIQEIASPRRWLLTATPYQSRPEKMWTLLNWLKPEQYPDFNTFKQLYCQSTQGLLLLHSELSKLLLRRTKRDTLHVFQDPKNIPFERQLADGIPRLPQKLRVAPEQGGVYELSPEQADLIAWMTADFKDWAEHYNPHLPNSSGPFDLENLNSLLKFDTIQKVIYEPERFGITDNPVFSALDQRVADRLAKGEKLILWAWNTSMVEALERRYQAFGVRRIDGGVIGNAREEARHDFQENPKVKILVSNYRSGGVGLTLTAADAAIFVQLPQVYPILYQAEGRHQRLIGVNNLRHAKAKVEVEWMLPKFPKDFVERVEDPKLQEILAHGTLVEQTRRRLEGGETLYQLLMEGYGKAEDLEKYFKAGLIEGMALNRSEPLDYVSHLKGKVRDYAEASQHLLPLWKKAKGNFELEQRVLQLAQVFKHDPQLAQKIGTALAKSDQVYPEDLSLVASLFEIKNKHVRQKMLMHIPGLLEQAYAKGSSLQMMMEGLKVGKLSPTSFLAQVYLNSGAGGQVIAELSRSLSQNRDTPLKRYLEEHFFVGVLGTMEHPAAQRLLADKESLFQDTKEIPEKIHALYRLGLLAKTRPDLVESLQGKSFDSFKTLAKALEQATNQAIGEFAGRSPVAVEALIEQNPEWRGNADSLLALLAGFKERSLLHSEALLEQYREALAPILDGNYHEWRQSHAEATEYLSDQPAFWQAWAQNRKTALGFIPVSSQKVRFTLVKDYFALSAEFSQSGQAVEGSWVQEQLELYRRSDPKQQADLVSNLQDEIQQLGRTFLGQKAGDLIQKSEAQEKLSERRQLMAWFQLDQGFQALGRGENFDRPGILRSLDLKLRTYRARKNDEMAGHVEALKEAVRRYSAGNLNFKDVTIESSDDPAIIARMGALHPELTNCFNPNGNPVFNQFVVAALGSKNMKMLVVREEGKVVALAMAKVKRMEDGSPVLFLERGLHRKGYDFKQEMLDHLQGIATQMNPRPIVMIQIEGKARSEDPHVFGTGAYTGSEYVEPVFGIRDAERIKHRGRVMEVKETNETENPLASAPRT